MEFLLGHDLASLLRLGRREAAQPLRLASGLGVWVQAQLKGGADGADFRHAVAMPGEALPLAIETREARQMQFAAAEARPDADNAQASPQAETTLREHSRKLIEETLAAHGGNVSQAARQLRVSRGTLYRRLRGWRDEAAAAAGGRD